MNIWHILQSRFAAKDVSHVSPAIACIGPNIEAMQTKTYDMLASFFCTENASPCKTCNACVMLEKGSHPDVLPLRAEKTEISVQEMKTFLHWLRLAPNQSDAKFGMLLDAAKLSTFSGNALLKTLEEPPPHAYIFLYCQSIDQLLPTIRSRVIRLHFGQEEHDNNEDAPPAFDNLLSLMKNPSISTNEIFAFSESLGKSRNELPKLFFHLEQELLQQRKNIANTGSPAQQEALETLIDQSFTLEGQIAKRYGNIALGMDTFLMNWASYQRKFAHVSH